MKPNFKKPNNVRYRVIHLKVDGSDKCPQCGIKFNKNKNLFWTTAFYQWNHPGENEFNCRNPFLKL